jgi:hypothetical protein
MKSSEMQRTVLTLSNAFQVIKETNTEIPDAILPGDDDDDDDDGAIMFTPHPIGGKNKTNLVHLETVSQETKTKD